MRYALVAVLTALAAYLPLVALGRGAWIYLQPAVYLGLFSSVLVLYYTGGPGVGVVDYYGSAFEVYMELRPYANPELIPALSVLAVLAGALAMPYSRGVDLEALEQTLSSWGPRLLAARLLYTVFGFMVGVASSTLALALAGSGLDIVAWAGHLGAFAVFVVRDAIGAVAILSGLVALSAGLSYATRSPLLVLVLLVMVLVVEAPTPVFMGGGVSVSSVDGLVEVAYRYDWRKLLPALEFGLATSLAGVVGLLVGWLRR